ncbi:hypothetical protein [Cohnella sp. LGH]|uniref:hypothetical protein n=1 Tax=Cohnella sp. LGH TaxID=1619153 RepID=UPI001FFE2A05|nr:hypothetical protein [Cohnella sp. LGH]
MLILRNVSSLNNHFREAQVGLVFNAFIAFISVMLLGAVIYGTVWWQGSNMSWKFTKWFFIVFFIAALITGVLALAGVIQF